MGGGNPLPPGSVDIVTVTCNAGDLLVSGGLYTTEQPPTTGVSTVVEQSGASTDTIWKGVLRNSGTVPVHDFLSLICAHTSGVKAAAQAAPRLTGHRVRASR